MVHRQSLSRQCRREWSSRSFERASLPRGIEEKLAKAEGGDEESEENSDEEETGGDTGESEESGDETGGGDIDSEMMGEVQPESAETTQL